jgi:hypothetical protein
MPSEFVSPDDILRLRAAIDRNQQEALHVLGRIEQRLLQSDSPGLVCRLDLLYRSIVQSQQGLFHRCGVLDVRLDRFSTLLSTRGETMQRASRRLMAYEIAMWASLVVSIIELFGNASVATYFVGLAVFFALMKRPRP